MSLTRIVAADGGRALHEERPAFSRLLVVLGGLAVMFAGIHAAAAILSPIFLAAVLAFVLWPAVAGLQQRGLSAWLSLVVLLIGIVVAAALLVVFMGFSLASLAARLETYALDLSGQLHQLDAWLAGQGVTGVDLAAAVPPAALVSIFGALLSDAAGALWQAAVVLLLLLFFLAEGPAMMARLRGALGEHDPYLVRVAAYGRDVGRYFALRALVNAVTGVVVAGALFALGVDFPLLWGVLTFFLSFIPYVGMFLASVPSVLLAWAEFGVGRALVVVVALTLANAVAENLVQPALMSRGLRLSPTFVFVSVMFWTWLIGGGGAFLAVPLSLGLVAIFASFASCRWLVAAVSSR